MGEDLYTKYHREATEEAVKTLENDLTALGGESNAAIDKVVGKVHRTAEKTRPMREQAAALRADNEALVREHGVSPE